MATKQDLQVKTKAGWHLSSHSSDAALRLVTSFLSDLSTSLPVHLCKLQYLMTYRTSHWNGPATPQPQHIHNTAPPQNPGSADWISSTHSPKSETERYGDSSPALNPNIQSATSSSLNSHIHPSDHSHCCCPFSLESFHCFLTGLPAFSLILSNPSSAKGIYLKCKYDQDLPLMKTLVGLQTRPSWLSRLCLQPHHAKHPTLQLAELLADAIALRATYCLCAVASTTPAAWNALLHGLVGQCTQVSWTLRKDMSSIKPFLSHSILSTTSTESTDLSSNV